MMEELIARLEKATGSDRALDMEIAKLAGAPYGPWKAPAYTSSLDAAITLVPEGLWITVAVALSRSCAKIRTGSILNPETTEWSGVACRPSIALCIASLKAWKEPKP